MRVENRRIILLTTLSVVAILLDILIYLHFDIRKEKGLLHNWLDEIIFFDWGWVLVFIFAGVASIGAIWLKGENILLRGIIVIISVIAFVLALIWFYMACVFTFPIP